MLFSIVISYIVSSIRWLSVAQPVNWSSVGFRVGGEGDVEAAVVVVEIPGTFTRWLRLPVGEEEKVGVVYIRAVN